jgi:hypothetical protein
MRKAIGDNFLRIAILLPPASNLGTAWRARAIAAAVTSYAENVSVVVGIPNDFPHWDKATKRLRAIDRVSVRRSTWEMVEAGIAARMHDRAVAGPIGVPVLNVPRDAGWCFRDCDYWILLPNAQTGAVADIKPTAIYCDDLSDRYLPELIAYNRYDDAWDRRVDTFLDWRRRKALLATSERVLTNLTSYVGARRENCYRIPSIWSYFSLDALKDVRTGNSHILLLCDLSARHDLVTAAEVYARYVRSGGALDLVVAGTNVSALSPTHNPKHVFAQTLMTFGDHVVKKVRFENVYDDEDLAFACDQAALVWSTSLADSEPDALAIAAIIDAPFLGCDHITIKEFAETWNLQPALHERGDTRTTARLLTRTVAERTPVGRLPNSTHASSKFAQTFLQLAHNAVQ